MIELYEQDLRTNDRQSSKGNQLKWEYNNSWYKADYLGYEGLSEYMISNLLLYSSLSSDEYVCYTAVRINYKRVQYNGVESPNFLKNTWQIITLERLFQNFFNKSLTKSLSGISNVQDRLIFLVSQVERITGLSDFGVYMNKLLTLDALFLNEDRHMHNIAVLMDAYGNFSYCPIFDNGAGLLSDTRMDYPLGTDIYELMDEAKPKTICFDFYEQLDISEQLYGNNLTFSFTKKDVSDLLNRASIYSEEERQRVETIILEQMRKYQYLFH